MRSLRIGLPFFYGRLDRLGLLPHQRPLVAVVGEPIWPEGVSRKTQERDWLALVKAKASGKRNAKAEAEGKTLEKRIGNVLAGVDGQTQTSPSAATGNKTKPGVIPEPKHSPSALLSDGSAPVPLFSSRGRRLPREVSTEEVNAMMDRYVSALEELFDKHKGSQPGYENAKLDVRSAR